MILDKSHQLIPGRNLFKLLLGVVLIIQFTVITYSHLTGFYNVDGTIDFLNRFFWGTILSLIAGFLIAYPDLYIIEYLNKLFPWKNFSFVRVLIQTCLTIILAVIVSTLITLLSHFMGAYAEGIFRVIIINAMIFAVCNVIMMILLEAWIFFIEGSRSQIKTKNLERELFQTRFEVLKNQINPHFMFNSLNVLSSLIAKDSEKAQLFIDQFSNIYRYVLETIEQPVVTVGDELEFARSYMFLQQIRFGEHLVFDINLPAELLGMYLPPLSLQVVLENVIKHNRVSSEQPLQINIFYEDKRLIIRNNIQLKISSEASTGVGQKNLVKRFAMISNEIPEFNVGVRYYQVTLPLIRSLNDEGPDY